MRNLFIALPLLALPFAAHAVDTIDVRVSGTLYAPSVCNVLAGGDVDLGNILTDKIDGTAYSKPLNVSVNCNNFNPVQSVGVTITGVGAIGATNKLPITGTAKGFQLALKRGGLNQDFNDRISLTTDTQLDLHIVPEKHPSEAFAAGDFSAIVTVKVDVR